MRHRRKGRVLGRSPSHQRALLRNLASALMLTEREYDEGETGAPKVAGRIVTTLAKAKEVRPLVERCITIAKRGLVALEQSRQFAATADRDSAAWKKWRESPQWNQWAQAVSPAVAARRRVVRLLGDKRAARVVFERIAPRYVDRPGGYTRILKLATPRLGDAGPRAVLEFVGGRAEDRPSPAPRVEAAKPART
jgi:large subunit ribosomal protein L17